MYGLLEVAMSGNQRQRAPLSPEESAGCLAGLLRVFWMAFGNLLLFVCALYAARHPAPSAFDAAFAAIVVLLIFIRYLDVTRFGGLTADGKPANLGHWRRYVLGLVPLAAGFWAFTRFAHAHGWM